jgi:DNA-directed RNA polymerase specialized sigma subunit
MLEFKERIRQSLDEFESTRRQQEDRIKKDIEKSKSECQVLKKNLESLVEMKNELLKTLTKHFSFSKVPREFRTKNKTNFTIDELRNYRNLLHPELVSYSDYWRFDKFLTSDDEHYDVAYKLIKKEEDEDKIMNIWNVVNEFEELSKKIFYLRYDSDLNIIRSNKEIARLLGYTRSYVGIILCQCMQNLQTALLV